MMGEEATDPMSFCVNFITAIAVFGLSGISSLSAKVSDDENIWRRDRLGVAGETEVESETGDVEDRRLLFVQSASQTSHPHIQLEVGETC